MYKIVMLSGGSESTALLFKEIREIGNNILIVHHVQLVNVENRNEAEAYAVRNIVEKARGYGDFIFTTSRFDYPDTIGNGYCGMDIHTLAFIAGHIAKQVSIAYDTTEVEVLFGASIEEEVPEEFFNDVRYQMMIDVFNTHFINEIKNEVNVPKLFFPNIYISIHEQFKWIPEEVKEFIISCRRPVKLDNKFLRCGNCYTCQKIEKEGLLDAHKRG